MITVHHLNDSRSQRILWLLEELELEYDIVRYERDPQTLLAPAALRQVHPLGKSPIVSDGKRTVAESGAIIEYLIDAHGHGRLRPAAGTEEALRYTFFLHYAEGSLMPVLLLKLVTGRLSQPPVPLLIRPVARLIAAGLDRSFVDPQLRLHQTYVENELALRPWFAGPEFSAADIQMSFAVEGLLARGVVSPTSSLRAWSQRARARPAYQRAIERGGDFKLV